MWGVQRRLRQRISFHKWLSAIWEAGLASSFPCPWTTLVSPSPPAAIGQAPAHRGDPSLRVPVHPCLVLGTASSAWPGGVMVGLLAMPRLSILSSCLLPGHDISWPVVSSAEVSFILNVFRGLCPCSLGTAELRGDGVGHPLHVTLINIWEEAKLIFLKLSPKPSHSSARLYNEGWKLGSKAG